MCGGSRQAINISSCYFYFCGFFFEAGLTTVFWMGGMAVAVFASADLQVVSVLVA